MDSETSSTEERYKMIEYKDQVFLIPIRPGNYILFSNVQALVPHATALTSSDKLIPFDVDPVTQHELIPKRVTVREMESAWQVHVPETVLDNSRMIQHVERQLENLSRQISQLITSPAPPSAASDSSSQSRPSPPQSAHPQHAESSHQELANTEESQDSPSPHAERAPPAFQSTSHRSTSERPVEGDAPPSYETSILGNIKTLTNHLRAYEAHIPNRHKSPRWLARRAEWLAREPDSIEQVAYQLVQLEMALLWTAVTESWIQERETWLALVASARSERHLATAMVSLERHTLVMDDSWADIRDTWVNELLELVVLALTHG